MIGFGFLLSYLETSILDFSLNSTMRNFALFLLLISLFSCEKETPVVPNVEFRGVWIASVANIDWPLKGDVDPASQRMHFESLLRYYKKLNYNAVIVQIRSAGDAFYPSDLAPWSVYLTGKQGHAPAPSYDPLAWMIEATHAQQMEFHAWMNPFRATMSRKTKRLARNHVYHQHKDWMVRYGNQYYINPGIPAAQAHVQECINEVVDKYDIDGIHFDDYFYPYKKEGQRFRDAKAYAKRSNRDLSLADWRRDNVNTFVRNCSQAIKERKPWVEFGISPFGVWRNKDQDPKGSDTQASQTNYDDLYADVLTWTKEGWVDYIAPQLYWSMDYDLAAYRKLVKWWSDNHHRAKLYIGLGLYKVQNNHDKAWDNLREIPEQISFAREFPQVQGSISFSAKSLLEADIELSEELQTQIFAESALTPVAAQRSGQPFDFSMAITPSVESNTLQLKEIPDYWQSIAVRYQFSEDLDWQSKITKRAGKDHLAIPIPKRVGIIKIQCRDWLGMESLEMEFSVEGS